MEEAKEAARERARADGPGLAHQLRLASGVLGHDGGLGDLHDEVVLEPPLDVPDDDECHRIMAPHGRVVCGLSRVCRWSLHTAAAW